MKSILAIITYCVILLFAGCNKKKNSTRIGDLPISKTSTPKILNTGQILTTNVRCELPFVNGSIKFYGFDISENNKLNYIVKAKAEYKDWDGQIGLPVNWVLDTSLSIQTGISGKYILNFYNGDTLFKADTVDVR